MRLKSVVILTNDEERANHIEGFLKRYLSQPTKEAFATFNCVRENSEGEAICICYSHEDTGEGPSEEYMINSWKETMEKLRKTFKMSKKAELLLAEE